MDPIKKNIRMLKYLHVQIDRIRVRLGDHHLDLLHLLWPFR